MANQATAPRVERWKEFEYNSDGQPRGTPIWETFEGEIPIGQEHRPGGGWLAPDGRFYRCPDMYHYGVARRLLRDLGVSLAGEDEQEPAGYLADKLGWARIWDKGRVPDPWAGALTQAHIDKIFDLAQLHPTMRAHLMEKLQLRREWQERNGST